MTNQIEKVASVTIIAGLIFSAGFALAGYFIGVGEQSCGGYAGVMTCPDFTGFLAIPAVLFGLLVSWLVMFFGFRKIKIIRFGATIAVGSALFCFSLLFLGWSNARILVYILSYGVANVFLARGK